MFYDDPAAAFANISRALRPAGRLVMMVWQAPERNEWDVTIRQALGMTAISAGLPDAFSLADPPAVTEILEGAGSTTARTWMRPWTGSVASRTPARS